MNTYNSKPKPPDQDDDVLRRLVRIETRLIKLMQHLGLTADGAAVPPSPPAHSTKDRK